MEAIHWTSESLLGPLQTAAIVCSLLLAAYTTWKDEQARRVSNSIAITDQHRKIWRDFSTRPELARVLDKWVDLIEQPVSASEEMFVTTLVAHLSTVFRAMRHGEFVKLEGLHEDIRIFFALPIPEAVWTRLKDLQDRAFVEFVETARNRSSA